MLCSKKAGAHGAEPDDAGSPKGIPPPVRMGFSTGTATLQNKCLGGTGMKHGKRFLWIVPLFCLLAACGGQGTQAESARWDTFHHEGDNVQLSLGMTQFMAN